VALIPAESKNLYIRIRDAQNFSEWQRIELKYFKHDHSLKNKNAIWFSMENQFTPLGFEISEDQTKILKSVPLDELLKWSSGVYYSFPENTVVIEDELIL
jgi:hypothetical protein